MTLYESFFLVIPPGDRADTRDPKLKQLTLRGFDAALERCLRELADELQISLNRAALLLMRRGAGLGTTHRTAREVGGALDSFIGVWSGEQEAELLEAIEPLQRIDPELWR